MSNVEGAPYSPPKESEIMAGDLIQVELDVDIFKMMQNEEHGGWNDRMKMVHNLLIIILYMYVDHIYLCAHDSLLVVLGELITLMTRGTWLFLIMVSSSTGCSILMLL